MTDKEKVIKLYDLLVNDLEIQVTAIDFLGSAVAIGGDELLAFDDGRGLWAVLQNSSNAINRIIKKAEALVSPVATKKIEQSGGAA